MNQDNISQLFIKSNEFYNHADYSNAIKGYEEILKISNQKLPDIYFNLGNAYLKSQSLGPAIFYYKNASLLAPRDPNIKYNLKYAKEKIIDKIEPTSSFFDLFQPPPLTNGEYLGLLALFSIILWSSQIVVLYKKIDFFKWVRNIFILLFILTFIPFCINYFKNPNFGVVVVGETNVYSAIGKDNVALFALHEGTEFAVLEKVDQWVKIELVDGKKGWIAKDKIMESH